MRFKDWVICLIACFFLFKSAPGQQISTVFGARQAAGKLESSVINEASGLTASVAHPHHFWTHNDSGDEARIFLINEAAQHRATYYLQGIDAQDWEEIGMMERAGQHYLLVGDIGDNKGIRPYIRLHVFAEPSNTIKTTTVDTILQNQLRTYTLVYEDGPRDAEALFYDPVDQSLYVISKRELEIGIYQTQLPAVTHDTLVLRKVGQLPYTFVTSAAISPDGQEVLVKTLLKVYYWRRIEGETIPQMLRRDAIRPPYVPEPQGEAITFSNDGNGYYTISEAVMGLRPYLYFYKRVSNLIN